MLGWAALGQCFSTVVDHTRLSQLLRGLALGVAELDSSCVTAVVWVWLSWLGQVRRASIFSRSLL